MASQGNALSSENYWCSTLLAGVQPGTEAHTVIMTESLLPCSLQTNNLKLRGISKPESNLSCVLLLKIFDEDFKNRLELFKCIYYEINQLLCWVLTDVF